MWVGPLQTCITKLLQELAIPTYAQYLDGVNIHDDGTTLKQYRGTIPNINCFTLLDVHLFITKLDSMAKSIKLDPKTNLLVCTDVTKEWDGISVAGFAQKHCWTRQAVSLLNVTTRLVLGQEADQVPLLYFLYYTKLAGGTRPLLDSDGGGQDSRIEGGTSRLLDSLKNYIEAAGGRICIGQPIVSVDYRGEGSEHLVVVASIDRQYTTRKLVMCCPPSCLDRISFQPEVKPWKKSLWHRTQAGCFTKVVVTYGKPFWREQGFSGSVVCENPSIENQRPISGIFDYCNGLGQEPALCCFICGDTGEALSGLSKEEQNSLIIGHLEKIFGPAAGPANVLDVLIMDWKHDPDGCPVFGGGGCPVDISGIGFFREHSQHLRQPLFFPRSSNSAVHFAGTETAQQWVGYMDGAVESAERVTKEVISSIAYRWNSDS